MKFPTTPRRRYRSGFQQELRHFSAEIPPAASFEGIEEVIHNGQPALKVTSPKHGRKEVVTAVGISLLYLAIAAFTVFVVWRAEPASTAVPVTLLMALPLVGCGLWVWSTPTYWILDAEGAHARGVFRRSFPWERVRRLRLHFHRSRGGPHHNLRLLDEQAVALFDRSGGRRG
jgi:hypothetical protein